MSVKRSAVLLVAAGLSTRMGEFKPLMELGGKPLVDHALDTFQTDGIGEIVIVAGYRYKDLAAHLSGRGVVLLKNEAYANTEMLDSIKIGLSYLQGRCGSFFVMPADIPLVRPYSIEEMLSCMQPQGADGVKPAYRGKSGHPLLLDAGCIPQILGYNGKNGLKGALDQGGYEIINLPLPDPGIVMDADTPEEMAEIQNYFKDMDIPSRELALEILAWREVGEDIINHSLQVAKLAESLGQRARERGFDVNLRLIAAGALLHDIERKRGRDHAQKGSALLCKMGYVKVAAVVGAHMDLPGDALEHIDECAIVYLADKLVSGVKQVALKTRQETALAKFASNDGVLAAIKKRMADARAVMERLGLSDAQCLAL